MDKKTRPKRKKAAMTEQNGPEPFLAQTSVYGKDRMHVEVPVDKRRKYKRRQWVMVEPVDLVDPARSINEDK